MRSRLAAVGIIPALAMLSACDRPTPDVKACEVFIQKGLLAPMTYRRISVTTVDGQPMSGKAFPKAAGMVQPRDGDLDRGVWDAQQSIFNASQVQLREVAIDYDAQNENGVPIRQTNICGFRVVDGRLEDGDTLTSRAERAGSGDPIILLDTLKGRRPRTSPRFACCL